METGAEILKNGRLATLQCIEYRRNTYFRKSFRKTFLLGTFNVYSSSERITTFLTDSPLFHLKNSVQ